MFYFHYINILFILYHFYIKKRTDGKNWQDGKKEHVFNPTIFFFLFFMDTHDVS